MRRPISSISLQYFDDRDWQPGRNRMKVNAPGFYALDRSPYRRRGEGPPFAKPEFEFDPRMTA